MEETLGGRAGSLKEYSLGVVVFDRGERFDPRLDPIVRVQARNLRVRLAQYYAGPGAGDAIVIELPKRTYVPVFRPREERVEAPASEVLPAPAPAPVVAETPEVETVPASRTRVKALSVVAAAVLLLTAGGAALWQAAAYRNHASLHAPDPAAQDLYIRGRYVMDRQTESALRVSIDAFQQAVARDPNFAPAYAGMADAYNVLAQYGFIPPSEGMGRARRAARKALAIDPRLAEAHVSLAAVIEAYDWDWASAEREYREALRLNASLAPAHLWYGMFLRDQGRIEEALPELRRAAQLEPFSVLTSINMAQGYMQAGSYKEAAEQATHVIQMAPHLAVGYVILSNAYCAQKNVPEAEAALARALPFAGDNPHAVALLARAFARRGKREESEALYRQLKSIAARRYVSPFDLGTVSLALGDEQRALDLLEEAYRQRSSGLIFLRDAKFTDSQRAIEFQSLVERMRFTG